jgi:hypothetical protein
LDDLNKAKMLMTSLQHLQRYSEEDERFHHQRRQLLLLRAAIRKKRPGILVVNEVLLHENARPHVANRTDARLQSFGWEIMEHAPYSPDLVSSNYHVFGAVKKFLVGQRFISNDEVKTAVRRWFCAQPIKFYNGIISKLVVRWDKYLNRDCDYVKKQSNVLTTLPEF